MFRPPDERGRPEDPENEADIALRQGLRRLPVAATSADFDARVHAALLRPTPWWHILWGHTRPILSTAFCSLLATLALLRYIGMAGTQSLPHLVGGGNTVSGGGMIAASRVTERLEALDRSIDSDDLSTASLHGFIDMPPPPLPAKQTLPKEPQRHTAS